jgi:hypothetical protein
MVPSVNDWENLIVRTTLVILSVETRGTSSLKMIGAMMKIGPDNWVRKEEGG